MIEIKQFAARCTGNILYIFQTYLPSSSCCVYWIAQSEGFLSPCCQPAELSEADSSEGQFHDHLIDLCSVPCLQNMFFMCRKSDQTMLCGVNDSELPVGSHLIIWWNHLRNLIRFFKLCDLVHQWAFLVFFLSFKLSSECNFSLCIYTLSCFVVFYPSEAVLFGLDRALSSAHLS